jgi:tartronate-semialdehyde synthase
MHKEDFQAVDITSIVKPVTKWATTVLEPGQVPYAFQKAFYEMRSGRPGPVLIDLPFDVQMAEIEFDIDAYQPLPLAKPTATRVQVEKALALLDQAERPLLVAGGGIINADASDLLVEFAELTGIPVIPTLMGWGTIPDDHPLMVGMVGLQTSHRYGNATMLKSDVVLGIGNRWANRHTGSVDVYTEGRKFIHVDIEGTQIGRVFTPDLGIVSDAAAALTVFIEVAREWQAAGKLKNRSAWLQDCQQRKASLQRKTHFDNVPVKPQRVYEEMNQVFGKDTCYVSTIGLSQIAGAQFLHVYKPRHWINCGQAGPLGWTIPAALGVVKADPNRKVVALSGDYDFQFMIEELAVGAQFKLPYIHVVVNNSYLGLIRQAQRGFDMDYCVQLSFDNLNAPELNGYGVDHVAVAEGLGCKALRVFEPAQIALPCARPRADRRVQGAGDRRDHPGARDQHLHGHRDQRRQRIRRPGAGRQRRADGDFAARLTIDRSLRASKPAPTGPHRFYGDHHAAFRSQPVHAVHRTGFPRPLRSRRQGRFQWRGIPVPVRLQLRRNQGQARRQRPDPSAVQPAGR